MEQEKEDITEKLDKPPEEPVKKPETFLDDNPVFNNYMMGIDDDPFLREWFRYKW